VTIGRSRCTASSVTWWKGVKEPGTLDGQVYLPTAVAYRREAREPTPSRSRHKEAGGLYNYTAGREEGRELSTASYTRPGGLNLERLYLTVGSY